MPRLRMAAVCAAITLSLAPTALVAIQLDPVVTTGLASPLFVGNAGDFSNRLFIVERGGVVKVLQPGSSTPTVFLDIRTRPARTSTAISAAERSSGGTGALRASSWTLP